MAIVLYAPALALNQGKRYSLLTSAFSVSVSSPTYCNKKLKLSCIFYCAILSVNECLTDRIKITK